MPSRAISAWDRAISDTGAGLSLFQTVVFLEHARTIRIMIQFAKPVGARRASAGYAADYAIGARQRRSVKAARADRAPARSFLTPKPVLEV